MKMHHLQAGPHNVLMQYKMVLPQNIDSLTTSRLCGSYNPWTSAHKTKTTNAVKWL